MLVSFDSTVTPIYQIPFPAVTICNMNKIRKSQEEYVAEKMESEPNEPKWKKIHLFLDEVCATHISEDGEGHKRKKRETSQDLNLTGHEIHEYLEFLAQPCDQLILR